MARFNYRMQSILDLKYKTEGQARMEFGSAQFALNEEIDRLNGLIARREQYLERGREMREGGMTVIDIITNDTYITRMDEQIEAQRENVKRAEAAVEKARAKLNDEMQERKMQERLRERAFETWIEEEKAAEAKELDERSSFVYGQKGE